MQETDNVQPVHDSPSQRPQEAKKLTFTRELRPMLYGFGDDPDPRQDSVELVEGLLLSYLDTFLCDCQAVASTRSLPGYGQGPKVKLEDIMYCLRRDEKKTARVEEMLYQNENLKRARRIMDFDEVGAASASGPGAHFGDMDAE